MIPGKFSLRAQLVVALTLGGLLAAATVRAQSEEAAPPSAAGDSREIAVLQGLDKITARVSTFEAPVDATVDFGSLRITARACRKRPPTEPPESAAFLEIQDERHDSPSVRLFTGWMFASSPALSAVEHPVYDVWLLDCRSRAAEPAASQ